MSKTPPLDHLLDKRLVFVTGKGGVGKTTVAAALGLASARAGKRTIVCELSSQERIGELFGREGGFEETEVAPDLNTITIDPQHAMEEYLLLQIKVRPVYDLLFKNRIFEYFAAATPGLRELLTIGKVWELAQVDRLVKGSSPYDLVIVDAPATGHGLALLESPRTFRNIARVGPIHRQAGRIASFLEDPQTTGVVAVTLPEEMPVNETFSLCESLHDRVGIEMSMIVANEVRSQPLDKAEFAALDAIEAEFPAKTAALIERTRVKAQQSQMKRLRAGTDKPVVELPFLFERNFGRNCVEALADRLVDPT